MARAWVTVLGPGGMGKTRLLYRFAERNSARFSACGGVWFVDLTTARDVFDVCRATARALGLRFASRTLVSGRCEARSLAPGSSSPAQLDQSAGDFDAAERGFDAAIAIFRGFGAAIGGYRRALSRGARLPHADALWRACLGAALATRGDLQAARTEFGLAEALLARVDAAMFAAAFKLRRGHLDLACASRLLSAVGPTSACWSRPVQPGSGLPARRSASSVSLPCS